MNSKILLLLAFGAACGGAGFEIGAMSASPEPEVRTITRTVVRREYSADAQAAADEAVDAALAERDGDDPDNTSYR